MFTNIKKILEHGDYKPVVVFLFFTSIWLGVVLFLEPSHIGIIPIPASLDIYEIENIIAYISILVGITGFIGVIVNNDKMLTAFLLTITPVYVFIGAIFMLSENPSLGSTFLVVAFASMWATIRSIGDGNRQ